MDAASQKTAPVFPPLRIIVGLGNPGPEYEMTRHNVGFMVVDRLVARRGIPWRKERQWKAEIAQYSTPEESVIFCKPLSYMNLSGRPVGAVARFYKAAPSEVLVIYDDVALPLGKLRFRPGGSAGGHNGVKSLIEHLATSQIPRLKLGIGAAGDREGLVSHVLGRFSPAEMPAVEVMIDQAVEAVEFALKRGLHAAMNHYN